MIEALIEKYLVARVQAAGGECIKFRPVQKGLPDRVVFMPNGQLCLVELKSAGRKADPIQLAWGQRFVELGFNWQLIDSKHAVDNLVLELKDGIRAAS